MRSTLTRDHARELLAGYISPSAQDDCITAFATTGRVFDPARLVAQLRRESTRSGYYDADALAELVALLDWAHGEYGRYTLHTYRTVYGPWPTDEHGDSVGDERPTIAEESSDLQFHTLREAADWLTRNGIQRPSVDPGPYRLSTWLADVDPYTDPYRDTVTETSAHAGPGLTDRTWSALLNTVHWR